MSDMNINERLSQIVELKGFTARSFSAQIGVSSQRFGNYLNDRCPDFDTLNRIVETFVDINSEWLLTGKGEMIKEKYLHPNITIEQGLCQLEARLKDKDKIISILEKQIEILESQIYELKKGNAHQDEDVSDADVARSAM